MSNSKHLDSCVYFFVKEYKPCIKKRPINKIVENDFFIRNELTNIQKMKKINNCNNYYYVCQNSSELNIIELNDDDITLDSRTYIKKDSTILLKFEDRELIYLKNHLKALSSPRKYIFTLINFYKELLHSIDLLVCNQIIHNHINFDSIVVDKNKTALLSNFSFSIDTSREDIDQYIKHFIIAYDPTYLEWPIELHLLSYLLTNKLNSLSSYNIETIISNTILQNNILHAFGPEVVSSYKEEALHYFKKYVNRTYEYILTDIMQYYGTWDNYALSIMFLRILIGIHKTIGIKNKFIILFMKLLVNNIHLNPLKRFTIKDTIVQFEIILDSLEAKDYKEILDNLTSA